MGICASSQTTMGGGGAMNWPPSTAMIINFDGRLQEFRQPITAGSILNHHPNCFLCSSETMFVGSHPPQIPHHEQLQLGQIYFLMPISMSQSSLSLQDLCCLAIKASSGLNNNNSFMVMGHETTTTNLLSNSSLSSPLFLDKSSRAGGAQGCRKIPAGFDVVGVNSQAAPAPARGGLRVEFYDEQC
ncbi:hypothetical protein ACSBR1_001812 [Camellia fascicularis]